MSADADRAAPHDEVAPRRAVLTLALGKPYYTELAMNLARSFMLWHDGSDIEFHLVTNHPELLTPDLSAVRVRAARPGEFGEGFTTKLHLDRIAPAPRTLFVDADCLVVGRLDDVFARFAGRPLAVPGQLITEGEFFGDVVAVRRQLSLPAMIQFVGGIYYLEPGPRCSEVFETARALEPRYDALGIIRLRGLPNEEPLLSLAMVRHGIAPMPEDGTIKGDAVAFPTSIEVDVFRGRARLINDPGDPNFEPRWPCREARPVIVHFNGSFAERDPYLRETKRLARVRRDGWPLRAATIYAWITTTLPQGASRKAKELFRPAYRRLFGTRRIASSPRM